MPSSWGGRFRQIVDRHPNFDFVLRSHSSANSRLCYELMDAPKRPWMTSRPMSRTLRTSLSRQARRMPCRLRATNAICIRETFHFNDAVQTPTMVHEYFERHQIKNPVVKVMVSGDSWSTDEGFCIPRKRFLHQSSAAVAGIPRGQSREAGEVLRKGVASKVAFQDMQKYFDKFFRDSLLRAPLVPNKPITYVLSADDKKSLFSWISTTSGSSRWIVTMTRRIRSRFTPRRRSCDSA